MNWRVLDTGTNTGNFNMKLDIALAELCNSNEAMLRFYRWDPFCISLGANQKIEEIDTQKAQKDGIDVVFRPTGGRAILHTEELTYSVIYPIDSNSSLRNIYHEINLALIKGLQNYHSKLAALEMEDVQPNFSSVYKSQIGTLCFAVPAKSEIKFNGRKLVGSAQKKMKHHILQHGSILCGEYHLKIVDYLNLPDEQSIEMKQELTSKTTDLYSILNETIDYSKLTKCLIAGFEEHFFIQENCLIREELTSLTT